MKKYEQPEVQIEEFEAEDIITTSNTGNETPPPGGMV